MLHFSRDRVRLTAIEAVAGREEVVDLLGGDDTLETLAVEELLLELVERLALRPNERLGALSVPAAERSRDQVGDTGRVVREGFRRRGREELEGERLHLEETHADDGRLGVATLVEAVDKAGGERDDVLEGTRERDTGDVGDGVDAEHLGRKDGLPQGAVFRRRATDGGLAVVLVRDLKSDVGTAEGRARQAELLLEDRGVGVDLVLLEVDLDTLDGRDTAGALGEDTRPGQFFEDRREELMRNAEDDKGGTLRDVEASAMRSVSYSLMLRRYVGAAP